MDGRQINWSAQKSHVLYVGMDPVAPKSLQLLEGEGWTDALQCVKGVRGGIKKNCFFFRKTPKGGGRGLAESEISLSEKN